MRRGSLLFKAGPHFAFPFPHTPTHSPGVGAHAASPFPPRCPERLCAQVCEHPRVLRPARWLSPSVSDLPGGSRSTGARRPPAPWAPRRKCPCGRVGSKLRLLCRPSPWTASRREPLGRPSAAGGLAPALPTRGPGGALPAASLRWPVALTSAVINPRERDRRRAPWRGFEFNSFIRRGGGGRLIYLRARLAFVILILRSVFSCISLMFSARG